MERASEAGNRPRSPMHSSNKLIIKKLPARGGSEKLLAVGGAKVTTDRRILVDGSRLTITHALPRDAGTFLCHFDLEPPLQLRHTLDVQSAPSVKSLSPPEQVVKKGEEVVLQCKAHGTPRPSSAGPGRRGSCPRGRPRSRLSSLSPSLLLYIAASLSSTRPDCHITPLPPLPRQGASTPPPPHIDMHAASQLHEITSSSPKGIRISSPTFTTYILQPPPPTLRSPLHSSTTTPPSQPPTLHQSPPYYPYLHISSTPPSTIPSLLPPTALPSSLSPKPFPSHLLLNLSFLSPSTQSSLPLTFSAIYPPIPLDYPPPLIPYPITSHLSSPLTPPHAPLKALLIPSSSLTLPHAPLTALLTTISPPSHSLSPYLTPSHPFSLPNTPPHAPLTALLVTISPPSHSLTHISLPLLTPSHPLTLPLTTLSQLFSSPSHPPHSLSLPITLSHPSPQFSSPTFTTYILQPPPPTLRSPLHSSTTTPPSQPPTPHQSPPYYPYLHISSTPPPLPSPPFYPPQLSPLLSPLNLSLLTYSSTFPSSLPLPSRPYLSPSQPSIPYPPRLSPASHPLPTNLSSLIPSHSSSRPSQSSSYPLSSSLTLPHAPLTALLTTISPPLTPSHHISLPLTPSHSLTLPLTPLSQLFSSPSHPLSLPHTISHSLSPLLTPSHPLTLPLTNLPQLFSEGEEEVRERGREGEEEVKERERGEGEGGRKEENDVVRSTEAETVELVCLVHGRPVPTVGWTHDGAALPDTHMDSEVDTPQDYAHDVYDAHTTQSHVSHRHTLTIQNLTDADFGLYMCIAENSHGVSNASIQLTGLPMPPMFTSSPNGEESHRYTLTWGTESLSPITDFVIK
ncbi:hypothetical protein C7M84_020025, partial [Penaeus vannamei]